jgi:hypothetical protein
LVNVFDCKNMRMHRLRTTLKDYEYSPFKLMFTMAVALCAESIVSISVVKTNVFDITL